MAINALNLLTLNAVFLVAVLILLVILSMFRPAARKSGYQDEWEVEKDLKTIKNQIEHEGEKEAEEELMPYKPPRLDKPERKRL